MNVGLVVDASAVRARLLKFSEKTRGQMLEAAIVEGLEVIQDQWQGMFRDPSEPSIQGAPPRYQTRTYLGSIKVLPSTAGAGKASAILSVVGLDPEYDVYLEYGGHPIARPAYDMSKTRAKQTALRALKRLATEAAKG